MLTCSRYSTKSASLKITPKIHGTYSSQQSYQKKQHRMPLILSLPFSMSQGKEKRGHS